ncbi:DNA polymerase III subunit delta' [Paludibacterium paludis]|uniref:DNA polymerase III subunit delta' n=1 Tax=Paludibacterium paludis TaxID=1225769 RepID=A0A918UB85_9NEIS|nr:DNA polymerase III subunit delta' [Paludibacterium paludis]GGY27422.1 DNA polymerase III subunit delta' [Paludibacterium paludis]
MRYPWQVSDWRRIGTERERLPNAWLLTGPAGIGKRAFAESLAVSLLCDEPGEDFVACGRCESCRWFAAGNHPDYRCLTPDTDEDEAREGKEGKSVRKLPVIKIEAVREVIEFAHLTSHRSGRRVILVAPAESLNPSAANALLKILEEPPEGVLFLLVAYAPQRLLPTIRSRCRPFALTAPSRDEALAWLAGQGVANPAAELAHHGGAPLFDHDPHLATVRKGFLEALANPSMTSVLGLAELVEKNKLPLSVALEWLQKWLVDLASLSLAGSLRYHPDLEGVLVPLARRADTARLMRCQDALTALAPFGQHTLNIRLQLEALLMEYLRVFARANPG